MSPAPKYSDTDIERMRDQYACGAKLRAIADHWRMCRSNLQKIISGVAYKRAGGVLPRTRPTGRPRKAA